MIESIDIGSGATTGTNTGTVITQFIERFEKLNEQKEELAADFKLLNQEIKGEGFDTTTIKELVKIRKDEQKAKEKLELLDLYSKAIQMDLF